MALPKLVIVFTLRENSRKQLLRLLYNKDYLNYAHERVHRNIRCNTILSYLKIGEITFQSIIYTMFTIVHQSVTNM